MDEIKSIVTPSDELDLGSIIQKLIIENLKNLNTAWLGEITKIEKNFVSVKQVIKSADDEPLSIVNKLLVAFPYSQAWQIQFKLKVGDIGLCIVNNKDLDLYKSNGKACLANTTRFKALQDSIFIPLSLFKTLENENTNFTLKSLDKGSEFTFDKDENLTFGVKGKSVLIYEQDLTYNAKGKANFSYEKDLISEAKAKYTLNTQGDFTLNSKGAVSITSAKPLKAGTSKGTLNDCFTEIFSAMDALKSSALVAGQATLTWLPTYDTAKQKAQSLIKQIVG